MYSRTIQVPEIMEEMQMGEVKLAVNAISGVKVVSAHFPTRLITLEWDDPVTWEQIESAILGAGFTPAHADKSRHGDRSEEDDYLLNNR